MIRLFFLLLPIILFSSTSELKKVSMQFHWLDQFEFAGFYIAKEKGFYKDVGLDVELRSYKYGINVVKEVLEKKATYAMGGSDLIIDIDNGKNIKLLFAAFQSSPLVLLTTEKSGIKSIKDFVGKRAMLTPDTVSSVTFNAMMRKDNVNIQDLIVQEHSFDVQDLIDGHTDLFQSYVSNEPYHLKKNGIKPIIFDPKDYGFDLYSDIVFTSSEESEKNKIHTKNFINATIKGWKYAFDNIDESVDIIYSNYNSQNRTKDALKYEALELKKLAYFKDIPLGSLDVVKLQRIYDAYNLMNLTKTNFDINKYILPMPKVSKETLLTNVEKKYLSNKKQITMCVDPDWEPYELIDENGNHKGLVADLLKLVEEKIDKKITLVKTKSWDESIQKKKNGECEILSFLNKTPERSKYLNFTSVLYNEPEVIVAKDEVAYINGFEGLKGKTIGIIKGYQLEEHIKKEYPSIKYVYVKNKKEALKKVANGEIYASINALMGGAYLIRKYNLLNIKIAGETKRTNKYRIGVDKNNKILLNILNKAVKSITPEEKEKIVSSWISVKFEKQIDYSLLWQIVVISIIILLFFIYRNRMLKQKQTELNQEKKIILFFNKIN
jgi:polar amino acid transport system substrate-binding protein